MSLSFYMKGKTETSAEYVDKLPEGMSLGEFREKYGVVVWCDYFGCRNNTQVQDTQRTTGTLLNKRGYQPLGKDAGVWRGLCTRQEIGLKYVDGKPECFTSAVITTGHVSFAGLLQSDGTPYGGNIDSQHATDQSFSVPAQWDNRNLAPRKGLRPPEIREY